eukprot:303078-Hanusia_phi.AAC.2
MGRTRGGARGVRIMGSISGQARSFTPPRPIRSQTCENQQHKTSPLPPSFPCLCPAEIARGRLAGIRTIASDAPSTESARSIREWGLSGWMRGITEEGERREDSWEGKEREGREKESEEEEGNLDPLCMRVLVAPPLLGSLEKNLGQELLARPTRPDQVQPRVGLGDLQRSRRRFFTATVVLLVDEVAAVAHVHPGILEKTDVHVDEEDVEPKVEQLAHKLHRPPDDLEERPAHELSLRRQVRARKQRVRRDSCMLLLHPPRDLRVSESH